MRTIERSVLLPHSAKALQALVNDVDRYSEFVPGCKSSEVIEEGSDFVVARLELSARGVTETLVTRNDLSENGTIGLSLVSGPFESFNGRWNFKDLGVGCRVGLEVSFQLQSIVMGSLLGPFFTKIIDGLVDSFSKRALDVLANEDSR
ncbi:MAG: type II toxin-antitoxin system RatA family toxin [Pseudomonadota bacterium]|nr:type II toxin-antitoxin system RatA family toxin [Pseudomonadota bacterium]